MARKSKNKKSPTEERLLDKAKSLFDKVDDLLDESVDKVKKSQTFKKAEAYVEGKLDDFDKSGMKDKLGKMADKAEKKAGSALKNLQKMGKDFTKKAEQKIEEIAENLKGKTKAKPKAKAKTGAKIIAKPKSKPRAKPAAKPKVKTVVKSKAKTAAKPKGSV